ncbi:MAG: hypothetical protein JSV99_04165 [Planctomycetota bacterium]|nr:MAG: hypothetical protein JSV99_04165 [Planctomycetota bacterium]
MLRTGGVRVIDISFLLPSGVKCVGREAGIRGLEFWAYGVVMTVIA